MSTSDKPNDRTVNRVVAVCSVAALIIGSGGVIGFASLPEKVSTHERKIEALEAKANETRELLVRIDEGQKATLQRLDELKQEFSQHRKEGK